MSSVAFTELEWTTSELELLSGYYSRIVRDHDDCGGIGFTEKFETCRCIGVFEFVKRLLHSRIPEGYWHERYLTESKWLCVYSDSRIEANRYMCGIGCSAVVSGERVFFANARDIIQWELERRTNADCELLLRRLAGSDVLLIADCDLGVARMSDIIEACASSAVNRNAMVCISAVDEIGFGMVSDFERVSLASKKGAKKVKDINYFDLVK